MPEGRKRMPQRSKGETELEVSRASAQKIPNGQVVSSTKRVLKVPDWRVSEFLHWMSLDVQGLGANVYPTCETLSRGRSTVAVACRHCVSGTETCPHILGQCPAVKNSRIRRHHKLCDLLAEEAESAGWRAIKEMVCRTPSGAQRRPDLVFVKGGEALVVDVTIRFEMAEDTLKMAADEKVARYTPVLPHVMRKTGTAWSGRGKWHPGNEGLLKRMGVRPSRIKAVAKLFSRRVLLYYLLLPGRPPVLGSSTGFPGTFLPGLIPGRLPGRPRRDFPPPPPVGSWGTKGHQLSTWLRTRTRLAYAVLASENGAHAPDPP
ncbi:hypothetical protein DPEC_G00331660 [Dallia pectoralis]|uniref:Uncharacterized protein n=1 Tax=Dallia pectoralis TaxID=75939 RepID=A0ACC2F5V9_DALPE|nr:hypothetical protein DPEC_G00331660 [Dallia pectoralis]